MKASVTADGWTRKRRRCKLNLNAMRYKGVQWRHNPREISFVCDKFVTETGTPNGTAAIQSTGRKNLRVKGKGELYGADCMEQFEQLFALFREGGVGILSVAKLSPLYAVFESLTVTGKPKPDVLTYEFTFREVMEKKRADKAVRYVAGENERLWDVSYRFNVPVETLLSLNTWVKRPDLPLNGRAVVLC